MSAPSKSTPKPPEAPLLAVLRECIRQRGPLSIASYMDLALNHPDHGYYHTRDPFGAAGDFTTAPEISQVFGELIGLWLAAAWQQMGQPTPFRLVELGPGRGQLMADLLRATARVPGFHDAAELHLVESSKRLCDLQRTRLTKVVATWHDRMQTVPTGPLFLIANEFFDALPVHQLIRTDTSFVERLVTWGADDELAFTSGETSPALLDMIANAPPGDPGELAEFSPAREALARLIGERIGQDGGVAAVIDYGAWVDRITGDTLQAVACHRPVDPLSDPGGVDLTTQVDFRRLGHAAAEGGAAVFGPVPQGTFLRTLGIEVRTAALLAKADDEQRQTLREALFRLTDASAMGEAFKLMALGQPGAPSPPGFGAPSLEGKQPLS